MHPRKPHSLVQRLFKIINGEEEIENSPFDLEQIYEFAEYAANQAITAARNDPEHQNALDTHLRVHGLFSHYRKLNTADRVTNLIIGYAESPEAKDTIAGIFTR